MTTSGHQCQVWAEQTPHAHTHVHMNYPHSGLGGHNHCRNPGHVMDGPWCYTADPTVERERARITTSPRAIATLPCVRFHLRYACMVDTALTGCDVPAPVAKGTCALKESSNPHRYYTLCPADCAKPLLGNGQCDVRCNITSCGFDMGDCGVNVDVMALIADQGLDVLLEEQGLEAVAPTTLYIMVGVSLAGGLAVGLVILRCVLQRLKREELARRGYTSEEMRGIDNYDPDEA